MKYVIRPCLFFLCFLFFLGGTCAQAETLSDITEKQLTREKQERQYLMQLVHQLDAMLPIIAAAQKIQSKHQRMMFHYTAWKDQAGKPHAGLLEDVHAMKQGILDQLNAISIEPRSMQAIQGDYADHANSADIK